MAQFGKVLLAIDRAHTVPQSALDCGPGLGHNHEAQLANYVLLTKCIYAKKEKKKKRRFTYLIDR